MTNKSHGTDDFSFVLRKAPHNKKDIYLRGNNAVRKIDTFLLTRSNKAVTQFIVHWCQGNRLCDDFGNGKNILDSTLTPSWSSEKEHRSNIMHSYTLTITSYLFVFKVFLQWDKLCWGPTTKNWKSIETSRDTSHREATSVLGFKIACIRREKKKKSEKCHADEQIPANLKTMKRQALQWGESFVCDWAESYSTERRLHQISRG